MFATVPTTVVDAAPPPADTHVIIFGDSQALGYLNNGPAPYVPTWQVQIWARQPDGTYNWNYMNPGINTGTPNNPQAWGAEVGVANAWLAEHRGDGSILWEVKDDLTVKGGTTLAADWGPGETWFNNATRAANDAMANLAGGPHAFDHYDVAFGLLGTNDATNSAYAEAYAPNLREFLPAAREAWHVTDIEMTRIQDGVGAAADNQAVRYAQWLVDQEDPDLTTFKTIGFGTGPDGIHYDMTGQLQVGAAFWGTGHDAGWLA